MTAAGIDAEHTSEVTVVVLPPHGHHDGVTRCDEGRAWRGEVEAETTGAEIVGPPREDLRP